MSLEIFKQNMLSYMRNQRNIDSKEAFAKKLVQEYDMAVKRGFDTINGITVSKGNTELMEQVLVAVLSQAFNQKFGEHAIITNIGKAFQAYWTGATMNLFPPPIPGLLPPSTVIIHIQQLTNFITSTGVWNPTDITIQPRPPGLINALLNILDSIQDEIMTPDDIKAAQEEIKGAERVIQNQQAAPLGKQSAVEYKALKEKEISTGTKNAATPPLSEEELKEIEGLTPDDMKCASGAKVVAMAKKDIGILEYGTPPGKNYGGFPGGLQLDQSGRIDDMFTNVGLDNQAKVKREGEGYYWCAAAVATWWKEAGLSIPSGAASCKNWGSWAKKNGYYSKTPKIGAAILYGNEGSEHHIGIVSGVVNGKVITIEGNTSGGGFNRNGCGCFQKTPKSWSGFVLPPDCV